MELFSGGGSGADTVINVATVEVRFRAIVLIEKLVFNVAYEKISVAGSHFRAHGHATDLFIITTSGTKEPSSETLLLLAELVLTLNCFSFAGSYYKQISGVAMGTKMGPSYANLLVGYIEHQFFNQYNGPKPDLYRCYIDDCVGATSSTRE